MCIICEGENIEGLKRLDCSRCPQLTSIPHIEGLEELYCYDCPWLNYQNKDYDKNISKLLLIQRRFRRRRFRIWVKTKDFILPNLSCIVSAYM